MENILLVVHLMLALSMIVVVLLQRSEGGALGIGGSGGGGGMSGFMTGRSAANVLTRATAVLAGLFLLTSIALAKISGGGARDPGSVVVPTQIEQPATPAEPSAPVD
jgi:preprotein translocase subunit SecG